MATQKTTASNTGEATGATKQTITTTRTPGIVRVTGTRGVAYRVRVEFPHDPATGKRRQRAETFDTMKEAEKARSRWLAEIEHGTAVDTTKLTVADVCGQWLDVKRHDLKPRTLEGYTATLARIMDKIGGMGIQRIRPTHLDAFYALLREEGKSETAVHRVHQRLLQVFEYAVKRRILAMNPMAAIDAPTVRTAPATTLTAPQIQRFLTYAATDVYNPLWLLIVQTGVRRGEALGLRWEDVDLNTNGTGCVRVRQCVEVLDNKPHIQTPKSAAARRTITLFPESVTALKVHRTRQLEHRMRVATWDDHGLVFASENGTPLHPRNALRNFYLIRRAADKQAVEDKNEAAVLPRFDIHDLRHTHASHLLRAGWDVVTVSRRLGHANPGITLTIYAHALADVPDGTLVTPAALTGTPQASAAVN